MFLENPNRFKLNNKPLENYASRISINMFACTGFTAKKNFNKVFEALSGKYENTDLTDIGFPLNGKSYQDSPVRDRIPVMQAIASVFGIKLIPANMEKLFADTFFS